jgi:hypothetical protein
MPQPETAIVWKINELKAKLQQEKDPKAIEKLKAEIANLQGQLDEMRGGR